MFDLDYHDKLHDLYNDYPLGKKNRSNKRNVAWLSITNHRKQKYFLGKSKKVIPNLENKIKYRLHYKNLVLFFKFRTTIKKIHRILKIKQELFLKPYIDLSTDFKREAEKEGDKIKKRNA